MHSGVNNLLVICNEDLYKIKCLLLKLRSQSKEVKDKLKISKSKIILSMSEIS